MRSNYPQNVTKRTWYYEEPRGILVVHESVNQTTGTYLHTDQFKIPWGMLDKSLKRHKAHLAAKTKKR